MAARYNPFSQGGIHPALIRQDGLVSEQFPRAHEAQGLSARHRAGLDRPRSLLPELSHRQLHPSIHSYGVNDASMGFQERFPRDRLPPIGYDAFAGFQEPFPLDRVPPMGYQLHQPPQFVMPESEDDLLEQKTTATTKKEKVPSTRKPDSYTFQFANADEAKQYKARVTVPPFVDPAKDPTINDLELNLNAAVHDVFDAMLHMEGIDEKPHANPCRFFTPGNKFCNLMHIEMTAHLIVVSCLLTQTGKGRKVDAQ